MPPKSRRGWKWYVRGDLSVDRLIASRFEKHEARQVLISLYRRPPELMWRITNYAVLDYLLDLRERYQLNFVRFVDKGNGRVAQFERLRQSREPNLKASA